MSTRGRRSPVALPLVASICVAVVAGACDPGAPAASSVGAGSAAPFQGELVATIATFDDGHTEIRYSLRIDDSDEPALLFASSPELDSGERVGVWGERHGDEITVTAYSSLAETAPTGARQSALVGAPQKAPRKFAFVLVDTGAGTSLTTAQADSLIFKGTGAVDTSLARYYLEESYGIQTLTGDIIGPLKFAMAGCNTNQMSTMLRAKIPQTYDQYGWYFNRTAACGWSGLATVGLPMRPARDTWFNGSAGCVVLAQEPGHNFGMTHSSTIRCPGVPLADKPAGACQHSEYGDPFDPMGHGCYHMNMYQKAYQGWVQGCNSVLVPSSGTFDIFPTELACNAIQVLQVPMPKTRPFTRPAAGGGAGGTTNLAYYYIEYRQPIGLFEKPLGNVFQGVLIHAGEQYRTLIQGGRYPYLLDMTPETNTFNDAALAVGKTFTDPAGGVSITLVSADATKATVKVDIMGGTGMPTCMDGTAITAPGPQACGEGSGVISSADGGVLLPSADGGNQMAAMDARGGDLGTGGAGGGGTIAGTGGSSGEPAPGGKDAASGNSNSDAGPLASPGTAPGAGSVPPGARRAADDGISGCACATADGQGAASPFTLVLLGLIALRRRRGPV